MSFLTYPLNNIDYDASDAETYMATRTSGIYAGNNFSSTITGADTNITIGPGLAWIHNHEYAGKVFRSTEAETISLGEADTNLPRYDIVAIRFDKAANRTSIIAKNGTPASEPQYPEIQQTVAIYELYLYAVYRPAGATLVTAENTTDLRLDPEYCGLMADAITEVDTSAINSQVTALIEKLQQEIADLESAATVMQKSVYDTDGSGIVDDSEKLGGQSPEYYATAEAVAAVQTTANNAMPKSGGTFTGEVYSSNMTRHPAVGCFRNIEVWQGGGQVSTGLIHMERK